VPAPQLRVVLLVVEIVALLRRVVLLVQRVALLVVEIVALPRRVVLHRVDALGDADC